MELSENTMQVLRNFASINSNIVIEQGNELKTISESKTVLAKATVDVTFPKTFGIYDLGEFLSVLDLVDSPNLDFSDDFVTISSNSGRSKIKYFYSEPDILTKPTKEIIMPESDAWFTLDNETTTKIKRSASVLGHSEVNVETEDGAIVLTVKDNDDSTSNAFAIAVDGSSNSDNLKAIISISNMKMINGDYTVNLSSKCISHFVNKESNVEYWVALQKNSTF
jgi:hypothetical protein